MGQSFIDGMGTGLPAGELRPEGRLLNAITEAL